MHLVSSLIYNWLEWIIWESLAALEVEMMVKIVKVGEGGYNKEMSIKVQAGRDTNFKEWTEERESQVRLKRGR